MPTRREKIAAIVAQVQDWDLATAVEYAEDKLRESISGYNDVALNDELRGLDSCVECLEHIEDCDSAKCPRLAMEGEPLFVTPENDR